ncbi:DNA helicase II [Cocleimonas sp. KMM 6892]|uniref:DNA helicase II n=1 Tax=unclassified Cocleimonas TaxID=2639732 RepID=UPI002DBADC81|nr:MULTISPECIES: DNA helicase II [unclassified Cocleimonas]MEB8432414.1 DNA helicase II [Cocleimonas sp. KMM 6892]MEC4715273.1 DNA helicase II [Cocleimonas sp. KMM 6895]MEC4745108.1 DNA helicase II [Cocleimonas sp. KMM 6896]
MDVSHILDDLNKPQREAVSAGKNPLLILAGAGSGKTRVLVHRIAWLIQVEQVSPFAILSVTFTNKAAAEMRGRIEGLLGTPAGGMWVGTFHGLSHRLLRRHWEEAKLPQNFQILDSDDQLRLIKRVHRGLQLDEKLWPAKQSMWYINKRKDEGIRSMHIEDRGDPTTRQLVDVYKQYEDACQRAGVVDFAELLLRSLELLRDNPEILSHYQKRFQHILVDEFQDTNTLQYAWIRLLAGENIPPFVVGDDDQSIYGWRGAKIEHIQNFSRDFSQTQTIKLEQNYRSSGNILNAANAVIDNNEGRLGKNLWTDGGDGEPIHLYAAYNEIEEGTYVASRIQQWVSHGNSHSDIAILYRSNAQSRVFESILNENSIAYRVYGGQRFFERAEVKDALAYLKLCANRQDDPSFERVINQPTRGIGDKTVSVIREHARNTSSTLWQSSIALLETATFTARAAGALQLFVQLIEQMASDINGLPLDEQVEHVIETSKLKDHYLKKEKGDAGQARIENLNELISAAQGFTYKPDDEHADMDFLTAFLSHASLEAGEGQGQAGDDCVQLMTLHSAKGLEFPLVFLVGLEEGLFPHQMSVEEEGRLEEERRLCYVGITRAETQLVMSYAEQRRLYGNTLYGVPSRFLKEIPETLIEEIRPKVNTYSNSNWQSNYERETKPRLATRTNETGMSIGQRVSHAKFGEGIITDVEGAGSHARVQVNFDYEGSKWLVLSYANLASL